MCPKLRSLQTPSNPAFAVTGASSRLSAQAAMCKRFAIPSLERGSRAVSLPVYVHHSPCSADSSTRRQEKQSSSNTTAGRLWPRLHCTPELQPAPGMVVRGTSVPAIEHQLCAFPAQMNQSAQLTLEDLYSGSQPPHLECHLSSTLYTLFSDSGHSQTTCPASDTEK